MPTMDSASVPLRPLNIVVIASEVVPFAKTGGLADVAGALPPALERLGHHPCVFMPLFRDAWRSGLPLKPLDVKLKIPVGSTIVEANIAQATLPGSKVPVYLIGQSRYFDRDGLYGRNGTDFPDNCERFVFFDRAVLEAIVALGLKPDVLHCNDWQTGLIPVYLSAIYRTNLDLAHTATLMTIHNMAYQGTFWHWDLPMTGLGWDYFDWTKLEFHDRLNFLKGGLVYSDLLNTVSPTYAKEIQTQQFGCGLDGLLRSRSADLRGIVNGIDPAVWNPHIDRMIAEHFGVGNLQQGKAACKAALQRRAGLPERPEVPLFAAIGRLDPQKGWDLLVPVSDEILKSDIQVIVLGEGQPRYHEALDRLAARHPGKLRAFLEFSNPLAHQIEAGADIFLMPSLYEPCGLNQLYSQAYGTVPVVRATGGLADTVIDANPETLAMGTATGFAFRDPTVNGLHGAIKRALELWTDQNAWHKLRVACLHSDWSWDRSARSYVRLYEEMVDRRSRM